MSDQADHDKGAGLPRVQVRLYRDSLPPLEKSRYMEKLNIIDGKDPLDMQERKTWNRNIEDVLPSVSYFDLVNYLVFTNSPYTKEQMKCYKSLEAYNQFVCGWVSDRAVYVCKDDQHVVVSAKVLHSQRLREAALHPWLVAEKNGTILHSHCDCQAGCGEVCTHVAALIFSIEATARLRDSQTVTEKPAYWKLPPEMKNIEYNMISDIDFKSAKSLKRKLNDAIDNNPGTSRSCAVQCPSTSKEDTVSTSKEDTVPSESEMSAFYKALAETGTKPVILSLIEPYCKVYIPKTLTEDFPQSLYDIYNETLVDVNFEELMEKWKTYHDLSVSDQQSKHVEEETRLQSRSKLWYKFRSGRITASKAKSVCRTDPNSPAPSLVKAICYPEIQCFKNASTKWGCEHEHSAKTAFIKHMKPFHDELRVEDCGFFIDTHHPYMGASPDGLVTCKCCGTFLLEIKCPFCVKDSNLSGESVDYLKKSEDGRLYLKKDHSYYYQVQTQLGVTGKDVCFFVVWTNCDLHVERIYFDDKLFEEICTKSKVIFERAVLPELLGKYFTRKSRSVTVNTCTQSSERIAIECWCFCRKEEFGKMILCDNADCKNEWFHYGCVGIKKAPRGKWFCKDCNDIIKGK